MFYDLDLTMAKYVYSNGEVKDARKFVNEYLNDETKELINRLDTIPEESEEWKTLLTNVKKKKPYYNEVIKYAMIKAKHIPKDIRMELIKRLSTEEIGMILSLKDITEDELKQYMKTKRYGINSELLELDEERKVSKKAIDLFFSICTPRELERIQFAPFQIAKKENEIVKDKIIEIQNSGIAQRNMEKFCNKVINNTNIEERIRNQLFDEEDINYQTITNPTSHMCNVIVDSCIQTIKEYHKNKEDKKNTNEVSKQFKLANKGIDIVLRSKEVELSTIQKLIDTFTETEWEIPKNLFSHITHQGMINTYTKDNIYESNIYELLLNELIFIYEELYDKMKTFVSPDYGIHFGKIERTYFYHMLTLRENVTYGVYEDIAKEPDEEIKYMRFFSFLTPDNHLDEQIKHTEDDNRKQMYLFFRFIRTEIRKVAAKNKETHMFLNKDKDVKMLHQTRYYPFYAVLKSIMDKEIEIFQNGRFSEKIYRFGVLGEINEYVYTEKQYTDLKRALKTIKKYYPAKEKLLNQVEKELDMARKKSAFMENYSNIFSAVVYDDGMCIENADFKNIDVAEIKSLASEIEKLDPNEKDAYEHIIDVIKQEADNMYYNISIFDVKEICKMVDAYQYLEDSIYNFYEKETKELPEKCEER